MYNLLPIKLVYTIAAVLGIGVYLLLLKIFQTDAVTLTGIDHVKIVFQAACIGASLLFFIFQWNLWRLIWKIDPRFFNRNFFPDLQGRYRGYLISTFTDSPTQIDDVELVIHQRLTKITVLLKVNGSSQSSTESAQIVRIDRDEGRYKLFYIYDNDPQSIKRSELSQHMGSAVLDIDISGQEIHLTGRYFNDPSTRGTHGDMHFTRYSGL